jgi:hypothetical protein
VQHLLPSSHVPSTRDRIEYARLARKAETGRWTKWDRLKIIVSDSFHSKWYAVTRGGDHRELHIPDSLEYIYDQAKRDRVQSLQAYLSPVEKYVLQCGDAVLPPYRRSQR